MSTGRGEGEDAVPDDADKDDAVGDGTGVQPTGDPGPADTDTDSGADDHAPSDNALSDNDGAPSDDGGDEGEDIEERDPYKRRVAVVLALLGVLGAWIGILHNDSGNSEATYARDTTRAAVGSLRANVNQSTVAGLGIDLDAEQATLGIAAAFQADEAEAGVVADVEETLAAAQAGIDAQDREQLERELTTEAESKDLSRTALAETRVTYNNRTSQYETVLTTLAVALFLVGFTLVLSRRIRPPILLPGLLLAAYVAGWAVWIHQRPIPTTDPEAIELTAEAATHQAFGEFQQAADRYTEAIGVDDDFRSAYTGRSIAAFLAANPDFTRTLAVVDADGALAEQAMADAEKAIELGQGKDFGAVVISGLYRLYAEDYDGAAERLTEATELNGRAPEAFLLLTAAELARGDSDAAERALEDGVALLDLDEASESNREFAAILFSLLEQVEDAVPERAEEIDEVRTNLAAGESALVFGEEMSGAEVPGGASFSLGEVTYVDGELTSNFEYEGLPAGTPVTLYIYEQPAEGAPFVQAAELARFAPLEGSGSVSGTADLERACQPVAFRYDVYVNGTPAASLDAPGTEPTC